MDRKPREADGDLVLVLELATRTVRAHIVSTSGKIMYSSARALEPNVLSPDQPYIVNLDPIGVWRSICGSVSDCVKWAKDRRIAAISTSSQRFTTAIIDEQGETTALCPNTDARGAEVDEIVPESMIDSAYKTTGLHPPFLFTAGRLKWFKSYEPKLFGNLKCTMTLDGWVYYKLTGSSVEEPSQAAGTYLFDIEKRTWSRELCEAVGIRLDQLPQIVHYGDLVGYPTEEFGYVTGISSKTSVVMGAGDTQCSGIGSAANEIGQAYASLGSTAPVQLVVSEPTVDSKKRMWTGCFPLDDRWVLESNSGLCGTIFDWLAMSVLKITREGGVDYERFDQLAKSAPSGSKDVHAFLGPSIMDARYFTNVIPAAIVLPSLLVGDRPAAAEIARACYEDVAFACRGNLEQMQEVSPTMDSSLRVGGGLTKSDVLLEILANVLTRPILAPTERRASVIGSAIAGLSYTESRGPEDLINDLIELKATEPTRESEAYESSYRRWRLIRSKLGDLT